VIKSKERASVSFLEEFATFRQAYKENSRVPETSPVRIAIIDTGFDNGYMQRIIDETHYRSWVGEENVVDDENGHGSYCAFFIHSIAPDADIYVARAFANEEFSLDEARNIPAASTS
jgi:hypothetical protein